MLEEGSKYTLNNPPSERHGDECMVVKIENKIVIIFWREEEILTQHVLAIEELLVPLEGRE